MKFPIVTKAILLALVASSILVFTSTAFAVSSSSSIKVRDFMLNPSIGKTLRRADVSLAIRSFYDGVRPRIVKRQLSGKPNCFVAKFLYKGQLKRISFNCTKTRLAMHAKYLK